MAAHWRATATPPINVTTSVKADSSSPFFHAHLQEGQRIDYEEGSNFTSHVSNEDALSEASVYSGTAPSGAYPQHYDDVVGEQSEVLPHVSRHGFASSKIPPLCATSSISSTSTSAPTTPFKSSPLARQVYPLAMPVDQSHDFWASVSSTSDSSAQPASARRYHYLTRSQSASSFGPSTKLNDRDYQPEIHVPSQYQTQPSPLSTEVDPREPAELRQPAQPTPINGHNVWTMPNRQLSPIEEGSNTYTDTRGTFGSMTHPPSGAQADTASLHSST